MGRKRINIDWKKVDKMLEAGCNGVEVAAALGVHYDTIVKRCKLDHKMDFSEYMRQKRSSGDNLLRMAQFKNAMAGNVSMQIWLGKNRLNQTDKPQSEHDSSEDLILGLARLLDKAKESYES